MHAAGGGVGSAAVQLAAAAGAHVIGVVGAGAAKAQAAKEAGAQVVIDRTTTPDLAAAVREATAGHGADLVIDPVGGDAYDASTKCIALDGRIMVIGFAGGRQQEVRAAHALVKSYGVIGVHWGLYVQRRPQAVHAAHTKILALVESGVVRPVVADVLPYAQAPQALECLASGAVVGRLAVAVAS